MANWRAPESATIGRERRVNNALSARRKPPNRCRNPRRRREIFRSSADGACVEGQGEDVAGEWVDVCGKATLGPENSRLMRKAGKKNEKRRSERWQNA
jgi:hypothetical protein